MKSLKRHFIGLLLCSSIVVGVSGCSGSDTDNESKANYSFWGSENNTNQELDTNTSPNIKITSIGGNSAEPPIEELEKSAEFTTYDAVRRAVEVNLESVGLETGFGYALEEDIDDYCAPGIFYYDPEFESYENEKMKSCGFYELVEEGEDVYNPFETDKLIYIDSLDEEDETYYVYDYSYENIVPNHFIYNGKYVQYYQQDETRIVYSIKDNIKSNYNLNYGNLYDYDNGVYVYDESISNPYESHSGISSFSDEDYTKLENQLKEYADEQLANGYRVEEYTIVYISPENIEAYLTSQEEDTFFGYSVDELTKEFGLGTAFEYTKDGFKQATIIEEKTEGYNWKGFLTKIGIGCGIILIGAVLTPLTGGASFGCALLTISKVAVSFALSSALGSVAIGAVEGLIKGKSIKDTLSDAMVAGLDSFANGFMIGAAIGSVGVITGLIKPTACFVAGTPVAVSSNKTVSIENIQVGDYVYSYNEQTNVNALYKVTDVSKKVTNKLTKLSIDGDEVITTPNHPFYMPEYEAWVEAGSLKEGYKVLLANGNYGTVESNYTYESEVVDVYNLTVEEGHTYYVGDEGVLVHNECVKSFRDEHGGTKAQREKVKQEIQDIYNRNSKSIRDYPKDLVKNIQSQKDWKTAYKMYKGELQAHHGITCSFIKANQGKVSTSLVSDPNNLITLTKAEHKYIHKIFGRTRIGKDPVEFANYFKTLIKMRPSLRTQITQLAKIAGVVL